MTDSLAAIEARLAQAAPCLNVPDDLRTECPALTPDTCDFYELAYQEFNRLLTRLKAAERIIKKGVVLYEDWKQLTHEADPGRALHHDSEFEAAITTWEAAK